MAAVTYTGPSGAYTCEHKGEWYRLPRGLAVEVPAALAKKLPSVEGHDFKVVEQTPPETSPKPAKDPA